jgi:hypothetical protein
MPDLPTISDDHMREMLAKSRPYSVVILKRTAKRSEAGADAIVWEHARRNFSMREAGVLAVVCPILDDGDLAGIGIFDGDVDEVTRLMDDDPGVQAGVFTFEVHPSRSFPGDALPG